MTSILNDTKHLLGLSPSYLVFDPQIIIFINSALAELNQLGIGPVEGIEIANATTDWSDLIDDEKRLNAVKSFVYFSVRLAFDPPQTGYLVESLNAQLAKATWRLNVAREEAVHPYIEDENDVLILDGGDV